MLGRALKIEFIDVSQPDNSSNDNPPADKGSIKNYGYNFKAGDSSANVEYASEDGKKTFLTLQGDGNLL